MQWAPLNRQKSREKLCTSCFIFHVKAFHSIPFPQLVFVNSIELLPNSSVRTYVCVFGEIVIISHVLTSVGPYFYHLFKVSEIIEDLHTCTLYLQTFEQKNNVTSSNALGLFKNCPKLQEIKWIQSSCHLPAQFLNEENKNVKRLSFNGENCQNGTTIHKKAFSEEQYLSLTNLTLTNTQLNYNEMITNLKLENFVNLKMLQLSDKNLNNVFIESENLSEFVESFKFFQGAVVEILQNPYPQSLKLKKVNCCDSPFFT